MSFFATIAAGGGIADVIFVHGITGDPLETWSSKGAIEKDGDYWPQWLANDLPHLNFYTLGFPASLFAQWAKKEMDLYERGKNVLETLAGYGVGTRPVVFICHSLGGLLVKQIIRTAKESSDAGWQQIAGGCKGILFMATPNNGSILADLLHAFSGCFASSHVVKLKKDSSALDELNESFRNFCHSREISITVYYEKYKVRGLAIIVDAKSADPGVNAAMPIPVDANHLDICKPVSRDSTVYISIRRKLSELAPVQAVPIAGSFDEDQLGSDSEHDRRDLLEKLTAAGREYEYGFANESQNRFARAFAQQGLKTASAAVYNNLLADVEQRFQSLIYHPLICYDADQSTVSEAVQRQIIDPLSLKYADDNATSKTVMNALYFLTERCHIRWDKP
jgi:predicted alpha/beta hydrolase family esterase